MSDNKVLENRLRRMADRQGLRLRKSRARDPRALTYDGYDLVDVRSGGVVCGWGTTGIYGADLEEIEKFLTGDDPEDAPMKTPQLGRGGKQR